MLMPYFLPKKYKKSKNSKTGQFVLFMTVKVYDYFAICRFLGMFKIFKIRRKTKSSSHTQKCANERKNVENLC